MSQRDRFLTAGSDVRGFALSFMFGDDMGAFKRAHWAAKAVAEIEAEQGDGETVEKFFGPWVRRRIESFVADMGGVPSHWVETVDIAQKPRETALEKLREQHQNCLRPGPSDAEESLRKMLGNWLRLFLRLGEFGSEDEKDWLRRECVGCLELILVNGAELMVLTGQREGVRATSLAPDKQYRRFASETRVELTRWETVARGFMPGDPIETTDGRFIGVVQTRREGSWVKCVGLEGTRTLLEADLIGTARFEDLAEVFERLAAESGDFPVRSWEER